MTNLLRHILNNDTLSDFVPAKLAQVRHPRIAELRNTGHRYFAKVCQWGKSGREFERLGSMATPEYYRKQIELLLDWADTVTNAELQISLIRRALDFLPLANWTDDQTLQRLLDKIAMPSNAQKS